MQDNIDQDPQIRQWIFEIQRGISWEEASQKIYLTFAPWVAAFFRNRGLSDQDVEDLTQDVFLQVFRKLPAYEETGSFRSWLFAIVVNTWKNRVQFDHRKRRHAPVISIDSALEYRPVDLPARESSIETDLLAREHERARRDQLRVAISELPNRMQQCTKLHFLDGYKPKEVAVLLRIAPETVRVQIHNAKKRLTTILGEQDSRAFG